MDNTYQILGYTVTPIVIETLKLFAMILFGGGVVAATWRWLWWYWEHRGGRRFDRILATITSASEPDHEGYRTLRIRNLGGAASLAEEIPADDELKWMHAAAHNCSWAQRWVMDPNAEHQSSILRALLNWLTRYFKEGEAANLAGEDTREIDLYFAPTGSDAATGGIWMFRIMLVTKATLEIFLKHDPNMWKFEVDPVTGEMFDHKVRVTTMREMADALLNNKGCRLLKKKPIRIVGWFRPRVRTNSPVR